MTGVQTCALPIYYFFHCEDEHTSIHNEKIQFMKNWILQYYDPLASDEDDSKCNNLDKVTIEAELCYYLEDTFSLFI